MGAVTMAYAHYPTFYEILWRGVRVQGPFRKSRSDASSERQQHARAGGAAFVDGTVGLRGFAERIGVVDGGITKLEAADAGMLPDHPDLPDVLSKYGITLISTSLLRRWLI